MSGERWLPIDGFAGVYDISSLGRLRRHETVDAAGRRMPAKILRNARMSGRYLRVRIRRDGRQLEMAVHSLVLEAFVGQRLPGAHGCHNDGDRMNNTLENLRWDTPRNNQRDKIRHGTIAKGERNGSAKLTAVNVREIRDSTQPAKMFAARFGVCVETVRRVRRRELWAMVS